MNRWYFLTILLYSVLIFMFTYPLFSYFKDPPFDTKEIFLNPVSYILIFSQASLLLIPAASASSKPIRKRTVMISAIMGAFPIGILAAALALSIYIAFHGDQVMKYFGYFIVVFGGFSWLFWGMIFFRKYKSDNPLELTTKMSNWLLKGSILELLIAIPSHIISRQREDCCAPVFTLLGISTGLSVALLSFGPGIYFLFIRKIHEKKRFVNQLDDIKHEVNLTNGFYLVSAAERKNCKKGVTKLRSVPYV